jgi:transposase
MFSLNSSLSYYLYSLPTDARKSFDGLCNLVQTGLNRNPMSGEAFVFINRRRDRMKLLRWEPGGFILYYKRLEIGTFELPKRDFTGNTCQVYWPELVMMVEGISLQHIQTRKRYELTAGCS